MRESVRNGPGGVSGDRAAAPKKKRGPILKMVESPPIWVGTGLRKWRPFRTAGLSVIAIRWLPAEGDSRKQSLMCRTASRGIHGRPPHDSIASPARVSVHKHERQDFLKPIAQRRGLHMKLSIACLLAGVG